MAMSALGKMQGATCGFDSSNAVPSQTLQNNRYDHVSGVLPLTKLYFQCNFIDQYVM